MTNGRQRSKKDLCGQRLIFVRRTFEMPPKSTRRWSGGSMWL